MDKKDFIIAATEYFKKLGYKKYRNYWFLAREEIVYCVFMQNSQWSPDVYYVEVGIALQKEVGPKPCLTNWYVRKRCPDENNSLEDVINAMKFFGEIHDIAELMRYMEKTPHYPMGVQYSLLHKEVPIKLRDMYRTDWTRIKEREYISRPCTLDGLPARESLILIREITEPLTVSSAGMPVKIVEKDYSWIQIAQEGAFWWLTAMFDEEGTLLQMYFDITGGNLFYDPENPKFRDMYLDLVLRPDGAVVKLDEDELTEALEKGEITPAEYEQTLAATEKLHSHLCNHPQEVMAYCRNTYRSLRAALDHKEV